MAKPGVSKKVLALCDGALELEGADREAFLEQACHDDPSLRASVDSVLLAISDAGEFLDARGADDAPQPSLVGQTIGSYKVLEKLGEGGMGSVYLAERSGGDFEQRVALKMVQRHLLARELIERFHAERRILAGLNHPYIAGLIDGGTTNQGVPFLVMEYIDGVPIDEYCDAKRLDIHARLRLIRKVAVAVQAAHQNLIVHRDLKPSNVLVTSDGIPKLLDFGIAKLLVHDADSGTGNTTVFGSQAMTPDYASPEQVLEGKVTTASDVYSLGVLTYQLLTGERPYRLDTSNHREMLRFVESLSVTRPSTQVQTNDHVEEVARERATTSSRLAKTLSGDLDTILMKALHKDPPRRYDSVAAYSADLARFLDGLPVEARGDSVGYRVGRFVGRHKFGVATACAGLIGLLAALGVTASLYLRAESARAEASQRFDQVRAIARTLMFDVYDDISRVPGTNSARETLAGTAQTYLEALSATENAPPDVQFDAAQGYARLARIFGRQATSGQGDREKANAASDKALALLTQLTQTHPEPARIHRALAGLYSKRGYDTLYIQNKAVEARGEFDLAFVEYARAEALDPGNLDMVTERFEANRRYADSFKWQNDYARAEELMVDLMEQVRALRENEPEHLGLLKMDADAHQLLGEVRYFAEDLEPAMDNYNQSLALYREHIERGGEDLKIANAMVISYWSLGNALVDSERFEESVEQLELAIELVALQIARDPRDANAARRMAIFRGSKADALANLGRIDEAMALISQSNEWFESQARDDPDTPGTHRSVAVSYQVTADILDAAGRHDQACQWWQRTLDKWRDIDAKWGISEFDAPEFGKLDKLLAGC